MNFVQCEPRIPDDVLAVKNHCTIRLDIVCHFCGEMGFADEQHEVDDALWKLWHAGWRIVTSRKFQVVAPACSKCAQLKDRDRIAPLL